MRTLVFLASLLFSNACLAASMTETPVVGAMTDSSCKIAFRTDAAADVAVEYATNKNFNNSTTTSEVTTSPNDDFTGVIELTGLNYEDVYWYRILVDDVIQSTGNVQKFTTFPNGSDDFTFAVFADVANNDRVARAYKEGKNDGALFAMQIGDMNHSNPTTLSAARTLHRDMKNTANSHGSNFAQHITSKMALVRMWDDHDYCGNDTDKNCSYRSDAWKAFDEHWPTYNRPNAGAGLWHSFEIGDAEFFVLDLRSQRDDGNDTDNSSKSMLDGDLISNDQKDWLKSGLSSSTAKWKFIISSVTFNEDARPNSIDLWHSFSTEAGELSDYIADNNIDGVIVISADIHTGGGIDDGTNSLIEQPEVTVPHTNLINGNTNNLGTWSEGVTSGAKGYVMVDVTSTSVTLEVYSHTGSLRRSYTVQ